jgi:hypothetical protein
MTCTPSFPPGWPWTSAVPGGLAGLARRRARPSGSFTVSDGELRENARRAADLRAQRVLGAHRLRHAELVDLARPRIVDVAEYSRAAAQRWREAGAHAWQQALGYLVPRSQAVVLHAGWRLAIGRVNGADSEAARLAGRMPGMGGQACETEPEDVTRLVAEWLNADDPAGVAARRSRRPCWLIPPAGW